MRRLQELNDISLAEQARDAIRRAILDGRLKPEERISIEKVAAELGISRTPVREALKALEGDGLVVLVPHRGAVVERLAREDLFHRYAIRAMIEGYAAELGCRANAEGIADVLEANCREARAINERDDAEAPRNVRSLVTLNQRFHATIHKGSGSSTIERLVERLRNPLAFSMYFWSDADRQRLSIASHEEIAAAFRANKPALARRLAERHLLEARDFLMEADLHGERELAGVGKRAAR